MNLVEFLRARLDEDEQAARAATAGPWYVDDIDQELRTADVYAADGRVTSAYTEPCCSVEDATHMARHDPARVLVEVEAKRRLLRSHYDYQGYCPRCHDWQNKPVEREAYPCEVVRLLALPYADHPDYRQEWRP